MQTNPCLSPEEDAVLRLRIRRLTTISPMHQHAIVMLYLAIGQTQGADENMLMAQSALERAVELIEGWDFTNTREGRRELMKKATLEAARYYENKL